MIVMKFGGTSVGSVEGINKIYKILLNKTIDNKIILVVSAFSGVTNILEEIIDYYKSYNLLNNKLLKNNLENYEREINPIIENKFEAIFQIHSDIINNLDKYSNTSIIKENFNIEFSKLKNLIKIINTNKEINDHLYNLIISFGEIFSSNILFLYFQQNNISINIINAFEIINFKIDLNGEFLFDFLDKNTKKIILDNFTKYDIIITQGFIANDYKNNIITLGRGGSDLSAAIFANLFDVDSLEIWTDVSGILTSDPRKINNTKTINEINFDYIKNMAFFGAKVLHPETLLPTINKNINVKILNTFDEGKIFTTINNNIEKTNNNNLISMVFNYNTLFVLSNCFLEINNVFMKKLNNEYLYLIDGKYKDILNLNIENYKLLKSNELQKNIKYEISKTIYLIGVNNNNLQLITEKINIYKIIFQFKILYFDFDTKTNVVILIVTKLDDMQFEKILQLIHNELVCNN